LLAFLTTNKNKGYLCQVMSSSLVAAVAVVVDVVVVD